MGWYEYLSKIKKPRHGSRILYLIPPVAWMIYYYQEKSRFQFMLKIRERDDALRQNAQSLFSDQKLEYSSMIDISNDKPVDSNIFKTNYSIVYSGNLAEMASLQKSIEEQLSRYNLNYLFLVSLGYLQSNRKYLNSFKESNPKSNDTIIAYGSNESLVPGTLYCFRDEELVYFQAIDDENLQTAAKTLNLKINRDLEKQFVKQIDF